MRRFAESLRSEAQVRSGLANLEQTLIQSKSAGKEQKLCLTPTPVDQRKQAEYRTAGIGWSADFQVGGRIMKRFSVAVSAVLSVRAQEVDGGRARRTPYVALVLDNS